MCEEPHVGVKAVLNSNQVVSELGQFGRGGEREKREEGEREVGEDGVRGV